MPIRSTLARCRLAGQLRVRSASGVQVLYVMVRESGDAALQQRLLPGLVAALKALP